VVLYGIPFEGAVNQRKGAALGPGAIRRASDLLESYVPALGLDLADVALADAGDLVVPEGPPRAALAAVEAALARLLDPRPRWGLLGGDHTITAAVVPVALRHYPDLCVVQFDAHPDLRREFGGEAWSYASAMTRVLDVLPADRLFQIGLRTGDRSEWAAPRGTHLYPAWAVEAEDAAGRVLAAAAGRPLYLTLDIDVLDPAVAPGTGSPEPGGLDWGQLTRALRRLAPGPVIGFDLVEVSPLWDPTGRTALLAAALVREAVLGYWAKAR